IADGTRPHENCNAPSFWTGAFGFGVPKGPLFNSFISSASRVSSASKPALSAANSLSGLVEANPTARPTTGTRLIGAGAVPPDDVVTGFEPFVSPKARRGRTNVANRISPAATTATLAAQECFFFQTEI